MSALVDSRAYATAAKAALAAQMAPNGVYEYRQVPGADGDAGVLPNIFALVSIERRYNPNLRLTAQTSTTGWRLAVRCMGRTVDEARWALNRTGLALNEQRLTVAGRLTTPIQFESDEAPVWDDGRFSAVALYVFSH